jgi:hypothetical protein
MRAAGASVAATPATSAEAPNANASRLKRAERECVFDCVEGWMGD